MKIDQDKFNSANPVRVGHSAMSMIDAAQDYEPEYQVLGMAMVFLQLCDRFDLQPANTFLTVQNIMNGVAGERPEYGAVKDYLAAEL